MDRISFAVRRAEIFGLLGPNGAGKSTTFKMLCGLLPITSGTARLTGLSLADAPALARARLGYMSQKFSLYPDLSVQQNLEFFAGAYGLGGRKRREAVGRMKEGFGLEPFAASNAGELPLGFKQRLALACAIMHGPAILFLDEPTSGVDPLTRREFWSHINAMAGQGVTVLVTTHFMDEAEYCDRVGIVYGGVMIATASPDDLKEQARNTDLPDPSLEDAFIQLIERHDRDRRARMMTEGAARWLRLKGLVGKETLQILRDPSSLLIAFVLPVLLLLLFGYGVSLDANHIRIALVVENPTPEAERFIASFANSSYFEVDVMRHRATAED